MMMIVSKKSFPLWLISTPNFDFPLPVAYSYLTINNIDIIRPMYIIKIKLFFLYVLVQLFFSLVIRLFTRTIIHSYLFLLLSLTFVVVLFIGCLAFLEN